MIIMNSRHRLKHNAHASGRQEGFTLVEVLIAVLVLLIGLLGLAGLQAQALRSNQIAYMRTQATILAYDIIERMNANRAAALAGSYDGAAGTQNTDCTSTTACSSAAMAANDVYEWRLAVKQSLPTPGAQGEALVCIDSTPDDGSDASSPACDGVGSMYAAKIWWDDDKSGTLTGFYYTSFQP